MQKTPLVALVLLFGAGCSLGGSNKNQPASPSVSPVPVTGVATPMPVATAPSSRDAFSSVDFLSPDIGWAAGADGIFSTRDGGKHWEPQLPEPRDAVVDIDFLDVQTGFALEPIPDVAGGSRSGGVDFLLTTSDGGQHWQAPYRTPYRFTHTAFVSAMNGWAVGYKQVEDDPGTLFHTDDGGQTWTEALSPANSVCFGVERAGWAANQTEVKHTIDGGSTWTTSFTNPVQNEGDKVWEPTLRCAGQEVAWVLYADGVAAGSQAYAVFRTVDGGANWQTVMQSPIGPSLSVHVGVGQSAGTLTVLDAANAWVVSTCGPCGENGTSSLEMTHDGGTSWESPVQLSGAGGFPQTVQFVDRDDGWLATASGVFATNDGGQTWVDDTPPPP
jgi:photosystem II stability/assembly factor-like uncharacterized protein